MPELEASLNETDALPSLVYSVFLHSVLFLITWSGSMCKVHNALQGLLADALMWHKMAFMLSGKVVTLNLDNSTAKECSQVGTACLFLSRLAYNILNLADKHGTTLIPPYIPTNLIVEADCPSQGMLVLEWHLLPCIAQAVFHLLGQSKVDLLASSHAKQC